MRALPNPSVYAFGCAKYSHIQSYMDETHLITLDYVNHEIIFTGHFLHHFFCSSSRVTTPLNVSSSIFSKTALATWSVETAGLTNLLM